jgi:uncharacterized metal-binding protein YceD (DUF177 family)
MGREGRQEPGGAGRPEFSRPVRLDRLRLREPWSFAEAARPEERTALATLLDAISVEALDFQGSIRALPGEGYALEGRVRARLTQRCVVSLRPVAAAIEEPVRRRWIAGGAGAGVDLDPEADVDVEPLTQRIDLGEIATEAVVLALDPYPRHPDAALDPGLAGTAEAGGDSDGDRPFAALAALRGRPDKEG